MHRAVARSGSAQCGPIGSQGGFIFCSLDTDSWSEVSAVLRMWYRTLKHVESLIEIIVVFS